MGRARRLGALLPPFIKVEGPLLGQVVRSVVVRYCMRQIFPGGHQTPPPSEGGEQTCEWSELVFRSLDLAGTPAGFPAGKSGNPAQGVLCGCNRKEYF